LTYPIDRLAGGLERQLILLRHLWLVHREQSRGTMSGDTQAATVRARRQLRSDLIMDLMSQRVQLIV
jgi:hypothetical protein